jgi:hypothetical protein
MRSRQLSELLSIPENYDAGDIGIAFGCCSHGRIVACMRVDTDHPERELEDVGEPV